MEISYRLPRLTRSLRAFSELEAPGNPIPPDIAPFNYQKWKTKAYAESATWEDIQQYIEKDVGINKDIKKHLSDLRSFAVDLTGGDVDKCVIDEAAIFLLRLFLDERIVLQKHMQMLKERFGAVSHSMANKIFECVVSLASCLSEDCIYFIKAGAKKTNVDRELFGKHIQYTPPQVHLETPDLSVLTDLISIESETLKEFSMKYDNVTALTTKEDSVKPNTRKNGFGKSWLEKEIKKYYGSSNPSGLSMDEFIETIVNLLRSGRSNDELQNELFDLLGFNSFELIQLLLENRNNIVFSLSLAEEKKIFKVHSVSEQRRPNFGCQVVVQSEQEKQLMKQARKEEKKISKILNFNEDEEEAEFDPVDLRAKRQAALRVATNMPSVRQRLITSKVKEKYPYVYDSQREVQQMAGYIAGAKIMLPADVTRTDNRQYEEVNIPAPEPAPVSVGNNFVPISSLDEIGQMAFQGMKSLNRIQTIVFDAAYHTNENLLICAPTGAGKTNVALLTIVHQIRQFMDKGVVKKDQFKIVYVAPMKALAAEMTHNFSKKLNCLGIAVRELTGDMQLTKTEILQTQMLITTPEKWDVVTRKGTGDVALTNLVKLLIIDEVHLLHGDRGPVVEALVARTLRLVESSQSMIRIVGLSATLPNYLDVARFLRVNPFKGLFYFDSRFRPVPLSTTFIGVKAVNPLTQMQDMDQVCYDKVLDMVRKGHQVMVFVHARNATVRTAMVLKEKALQQNNLKVFETQDSGAFTQALKAMRNSKNKQLGELFACGFSVHHAGMLRVDRSMVEKYFGEGFIKVLVCTATLAWGVNLPAHAVIIRGTEIYDAKCGSFVDLGILDVLQIFGRAGRPQFDKSGHGTIITSHDKLNHYLSLLTNQFPIESNFIKFLADNLNAEISLGTVSNVDEAVEWLSYTYLFVRMRINPQHYGINYQDVQDDPSLRIMRHQLIVAAAKKLDAARMVRYNPRTGDLAVTDLGRTASNFYIKYDTVEIFNELMTSVMAEDEILNMLAHASEFEQLKVRDDELSELDDLLYNYCKVVVIGACENLNGKINILMQTFLSRGRVNSFSLMSDQAYVIQNAVRIMRALFDIMLRKNNPLMAGRFLMLCKMFEQQQWDFQSPLRQFRILGTEIIEKIEDRKLNVEKLREMDVKEIGLILRNPRMGKVVKRCAEEFPLLELSATLQPITRTVLRIRLQICANFRWNDSVHGKTSQSFYIWIEDPEQNYMYHSEYFLITRKQVYHQEIQELVMTIPLVEPLPPQYYVRVISDQWLGSDSMIALSFQHLILPESHPPHTDLLELQPLPVAALKDPKLEALYPFKHFNPIQTQIFHCIYHTDNNVLLGAPTGSGKTIAAEIAMFRVFRQYKGCKVVYIAPLKALVRERIEDWKVKLEAKLGLRVVELTGDVTPDIFSIKQADIIVTTPEKWDGISRSWQTRNYVRDVALIVIDEIHLLGEDRGPVLEVIVSRTNFISSHTSHKLRIVGLSTALANAKDLANWLGIKEMGLYNFRPSVRPVPLEVHISGFPGKHYCPRMATMNRPTFQAIRQHSPAQPVLIFVSSRRQTRLTALDLIAYLAAEDNPKQWLHMSEQQMEQIVSGIKDSNLKLTLAFGIGMHHAGLQEKDRKTVEELFVNQRIQILIATATLAWGVNFPAHLVVVKGTEYYDGKSHRYVDMPITDVLQMMGRAGRPQYDDHGVAVVLVHDVKKNFYKKFLYEPFPVESSLLDVIPDHINAEIVAATIRTKQDALDYLTWTYFFRRLLKNPTYYNLESVEPQDVNLFLSNLIQRALNTLAEAYCIGIEEDERSIYSTSMGRIASFYYLSHQTMQLFHDQLGPDLNQEQLLKILSDVHEYEQLPVRHNEDILNADLAKGCPLKVDSYSYDSPHTKALLLFQAHFSRLQLPCTDYFTDLKSVLDQSIRILQAMIDVCAERGWLASTLRTQQIMQMVIQGRWAQECSLLILPHIEPHHMYLFRKSYPHLKEKNIWTLPGLKAATCRNYSHLANILRSELREEEIEQVHKVLLEMPTLNVSISIRGWWEQSENYEDKSFKQPPSRTDWIQVHADQEYTLMVKMERINRTRDLKAHCPKFPRGKDEGWFLNLGNIDSGELMALKRVSGIRGGRSSQQLTFFTPNRTGRLILTLFIISDCYIGLDQQYDLQLDILPASIKAQVNTELKDLNYSSDGSY